MPVISLTVKVKVLDLVDCDTVHFPDVSVVQFALPVAPPDHVPVTKAFAT